VYIECVGIVIGYDAEMENESVVIVAEKVLTFFSLNLYCYSQLFVAYNACFCWCFLMQ